MLLLPHALLEQVSSFVERRSCTIIASSLRSSSCFSRSRCLHSASTAQQDQDRPVRLRFAPSPTGSLHLGGLRTALFNHLLARKLGGSWILRIEDTDRTRFVPGAQDELIKCLRWAGLDFDEGPGRSERFGPYIQSERRHIYDRHLERLLESDSAYRCFCSSERLDALRFEARRRKSPTHYDGLCRHLPQSEIDQRIARNEPYVIRFRNNGLPEEQHDLVYGTIRLPNVGNEDFILVKSDGMPTYHFANVVDDHEMRISHVLRGEEWILSTPKHIALYEALGWRESMPSFAHMPILVNPDGSKLSKRSGDVKVSDYIAKGWEPEALINFVALMGATWLGAKDSAGAPLTEVMSMQEMIENFSLSNLNKHRSTMSAVKLSYLNRGHLQRKLERSDETLQLVQRATEAVKTAFPDAKARVLEPTYIEHVLKLTVDRIETLGDLPLVSACFFERPDYASKEAQVMRRQIKTETLAPILTDAKEILQTLRHSDATESDIAQSLSEMQESRQLRGGALMTPLRYALTGQKAGPGVAATIHVLGAQEAISRLEAVIEREEQASSLRVSR